jgi:hypothetical protein
VARMREGRKECKVWLEKPEERDHLKDQGVGGKMGLEWILGTLACGGVDWIRLAQDRDRWRAVVSAVVSSNYGTPFPLFSIRLIHLPPLFGCNLVSYM